MNESVSSTETIAKNSAAKKMGGDVKKDSPGVVIPPPLFYVAIFFLSVLLQGVLPLPGFISGTTLASVTGYVFLALWLCFAIPSFQKFIASKNTLVTVKPASTLQTRGIYSFTRNPMYLSLILLYVGIAMFKGNWYSFLLLPVLIAIVQFYIIRREEKYLERAFGEDYRKYRTNVRRWI